MKITCARDEILDGIQSVQNVSGLRGTIPILANVLIEAGKDSVTFTATDLEVGIRRTIPARVERKGAITLPAKRLHAILRELPGKDVSLEAGDQKEAVIRHGTSFFRILAMPKEEFPDLPDHTGWPSVSVPQALLAELIRLTSYAISRDESRYVLTGLYLAVSKNKITGVATDGRRLAHYETAVEGLDGKDRKMLIPAKAVAEIGRILSAEGDASIHMGTNQAAVSVGSCTLVTRLIEGHFPNYDQVIPSKPKHVLALDREELLNATRRVALMTSEQANSVRMALRKNSLVISTAAPDVGEAREELTIAYAGEEVVIAFNPHFLTDALKSIVEKEITFEFTDALNPGLIRSGKSFLYVIMPIRLT
ncbi:MAG: DNA polymerase III subunit beta [bacterium]|nr:DNA polymerase III subunit beta [bacterium]